MLAWYVIFQGVRNSIAKIYIFLCFFSRGGRGFGPPVPHLDPHMVVVEELRSMLSKEDVVNYPFCKTAGQTTQSSIN